jgi:diadenosine tetraphosphate (Ap4A) HIT family hydrolase
MPCPFCNVIELKYRLLEEGDDFIVILSDPRLMPGHTLVIPKRHILKPSEMTAEERINIFNAILKWQDIITGIFSTGCDVRQNYRPFIKENVLKIDHVHYHLIPREFEDKHFFIVDKNAQTLFEPLSEEERKKIEGVYLK